VSLLQEQTHRLQPVRGFSRSVSSSLSYRLGAKIPVQGAAWGCAHTGPRYYPAVCSEMNVTIIKGLLSRDHVHMFALIPPHVAVSAFVQKAKGRSSRRIQQEFEHIRKRYWGQRFWARGYFCTTSGNITDEVIMRYLENHAHHTDRASAPNPKPTGASR